MSYETLQFLRPYIRVSLGECLLDQIAFIETQSALKHGKFWED